MEMEFVQEFDARFSREALNIVGPLKYQWHLYTLVREHRPDVVVETGIHHGVSTVSILAALERNGGGCLYSCDPRWPSQKVATEHLREVHGAALPSLDTWTFFGEESKTALPKITADWDFFVHDSEHGVDRSGVNNMAWELEFALTRLRRPGGVLVCDDWDWPPGDTWTSFVKKYDLSYELIGSAAVALL